MSKKFHPISSYDKYVSLKVSRTMWLTIIFLLRPYLILFASVTNRKDKMLLINIFYSDRLAMSLAAVAGIPAALLVYAWVKRNPDASSFVRQVWKRGRLLLVISAALSAFVVFVPLWLGTVHKVTEYGWGQFFISLLIVIVVYRSQYIKDCFSDWPEKQEETTPRRKRMP